MDKDSRVNFRLSAKELKRLKELSRQTGKSMSELFREWVEKAKDGRS